MESKSLDEVMELISASRLILNKWRNRFRAHGIEGLKDAYRSGKPAVFIATDKTRIIQRACEKPSGEYTDWPQRRIAERAGMNQSKVNQILKKAALNAHSAHYWCGKSPYPEFESKMLHIVGLYMNPPENAIVLCIDEKTQMQALAVVPAVKRHVAAILTMVFIRHAADNVIGVHNDVLKQSSFCRLLCLNILN